MLAFTPSRRDYAELKKRIEAFRPDWLLLDHWLGYLTARSLATELERPLVYRSQNVEHRYYRELRRLARGTIKIKLMVNAMRLFAAEREIRTSVDLVADISADDTKEWATLGGAGNALVVPPLWLDRVAPEQQGRKRHRRAFCRQFENPQQCRRSALVHRRCLADPADRTSPRAPASGVCGIRADAAVIWPRGVRPAFAACRIRQTCQCSMRGPEWS